MLVTADKLEGDIVGKIGGVSMLMMVDRLHFVGDEGVGDKEAGGKGVGGKGVGGKGVGGKGVAVSFLA